MDLNKIYSESCLETLKRMPDEFIDCVVTSPPYYGLRAYNAPDSVWGGWDNCSHVFGESLVIQKRGGLGNSTLEGGKDTQIHQGLTQNLGSFCTCGARKGQLGLEPNFKMYIEHLIEIFREIKRVLKKSGTVWVNIGDSYSSSAGGYDSTGSRGTSSQISAKTQAAVISHKERKPQPGIKPKSLMNIPNRFAIAMTDELGFIQRNEVIWHKPACMPSSASDRFTVDFEKIFFFSKSEKYYFEQQKESLAKSSAIRLSQDLEHQAGSSRAPGGIKTIKAVGCLESGARNMRTTWSISYEPSSENHYASYPTKLIETPIKAGCPVGGIVYEPFTGTGTTLVVAHKLGRDWIGSEISEEYTGIANSRLMPYLAQETLF